MFYLQTITPRPERLPLREFLELSRDWLFSECSDAGKEKLLKDRAAANERLLREPVSG